MKNLVLFFAAVAVTFAVSCGGSRASSGARTTPHGYVDSSGGAQDDLEFAVVGDTRPSVPYVTGYPTGIITKIWQDIDAEDPKPGFAIATGDYLFSDPYSDEGAEQLDLYLGARSNFANTVFYAMGNHECATVTSLNCGPGSFFGDTHTYKAFMAKMLQPMGHDKPYYSFRVDASDQSWTSKYVVLAGNYWNDDQAAFLDNAMAEPTTYTFVVRHEGYLASSAPGVTPSEAIIAQYPYTLMLGGHVHTFRYDAGHKEVLTGNGGAPLVSGVNYGYTLVKRRADGAIEVTNYDYENHSVIGTFAVDADGQPAP
jgi:hypothetical protein